MVKQSQAHVRSGRPVSDLQMARLDYEAADKVLSELFPQRLIHRVLLIAPPDADVTMFNYATAKRRRYWNFAPYGLGVIATHLCNEGIEVDILNLNHVVLKACQITDTEKDFDFESVWKTALSGKLLDFHPDFIGITCMFTQTHRSTVNVCNELKRLVLTIPIALGGVHLTNSLIDEVTAIHLIHDLVDVSFFFLYEAELAFTKFINVVNREMPVDELAQVF